MVKAIMEGWWRFVRRALLVVVVLAVVFVVVADFLPARVHTETPVAFSDFLTELNAGNVRDVIINGQAFRGQLVGGRLFATYAPTESNFVVQRLIEKNVRIIVMPTETDVNPLLHYLLSWLPSLVLWVVAFRYVGVRVRNGAERAVARRIVELETRLRKLEAGLP